MTESPTWDVKATRELIDKLYGNKQSLIARQSINSVLQRRDFARFHYFEAFERWDEHLEDIKDESPINIVLACADEITNEKRANLMEELAAHVHSCVHSLHTIPDIMGHALYYGLALDSNSPLSERRITAKSVAKILVLDESLTKLGELLESIYLEGSFNYIDALNNHGKHRSIIRPGTWFDLRAKSELPITLEFSEFIYDGVSYKRQQIKPILSQEYERIAASIIYCGIEFSNVLKNRAALQGGS
jgi:hypothetical protein